METSRARFPLLAVALLTALLAMWAGLMRLGWALPPLTNTLTGVHGALMVSGVLGTLISLERVVALGRRWAYAAPALTALGVVALLIGAPLGALAMTLGSLVMVAVFGIIVRRHPALFTATMMLGTAAWFIGNALWLAGQPIHRVVWWWGGYLVLTIVGERLELGRILRLSSLVQGTFLGAVIVYLAGLVLTLAVPDLGARVAGAGMFALALWLLRYDIARRSVRQTGLTRFIAACMLAGYVWLAASGALAIVFGAVSGGAIYDAMLHTLFLGFVSSMIFGHAPIILPALLGIGVPYRAAFYAHLILLHASLLWRVSGDLLGSFDARQWGGMFNVIAGLLFLFNTARALQASLRLQASEKTLRNIFLSGTLIFLVIFLGMTIDSLTQVVNARTAQVTDQVVAGKRLWQNKNCNDCHTILGIGGYFAPELTTVYDRRGAAWLQAWLKNPPAVIPGTTMPHQNLTDAQVSDLVAFLRWVSQIDTNNWPPQPIGATGAGSATPDGATLFRQKGCIGCHAINGPGGTFGPALSRIGSQPYDALPNTPEFLAQWLTDPAAQKPGTTMPRIALTPAERDALVQYLTGLK